MNPYIELSVGFARTGLTGFGGGPSTIPLIEHETVKKYKWMTEEEFGEVLALANTLPGPIATKMAAYIGYKVKGMTGALVAILTHVLPSIVALIALLGALYAFRNSPIVGGMVLGVSPVIGYMLAEMAYRFYEKGHKGLGLSKMIIFTILSFVLMQVIGIHPGIVIATFLLSAFFIAHRKRRAAKTTEVVINRKEKSL